MALKHSMGGRVMAIRQRKEALERYYLNPNKCKQCLKIIDVKEKEKVSQVRKKVFCNQSCAASYNMLGRQHNKKTKKEIICRRCSENFMPNKKERFCINCMKFTRLSGADELTKGELIAKRKNWQSWRGSIVKNSKQIMSKHYIVKQCRICGYDRHVEVCHIKSVSSFSNSVLISEINDIKNLMYLCPTHHWEFDNGLLENLAT